MEKQLKFYKYNRPAHRTHTATPCSFVGRPGLQL